MYLIPEDGIIDDVAVDRVVKGWHAPGGLPTCLTLKERYEVVRQLVALGRKPAEIERHMLVYAGVSTRSKAA